MGLSRRVFTFLFAFSLSLAGLYADDRAFGPQRLAELLLAPENHLASTEETDFYYSLGPDSQSLERESLSFYLDAYEHLGSQNDNAYFRKPLANRHDFVGKVNRTRYPILFVNNQAEAGLLLGKEVNVLRKREAFGAIQTNRPPGYANHDFHSADALDLPRWLTYYLVFAKKAPKRLEQALSMSGYSPDDYFVIYLMPETYDWAVGERVPFLPFVLPRSLFQAHGFEAEQLDFKRARVVFPQDSIQAFEESGDFRDFASAGIHIPIKNSEDEEFFMPFSVLEKVYKTLHSIFLMSVGLANPRHFEELISRVENLTEDLVAQNFYNAQQAEQFSSLLSVLITEAILHPTDMPEGRAQNRQMSSRGPISTSLRAGLRAVEDVKTSYYVEQIATLISKTKEKLGRNSDKSLSEDKKELRDLLRNAMEAQHQVLQDTKHNGFSIQDAQEWPKPLAESSQETASTPSKRKKWTQRLILGSICSIPFATVASGLLPVVISEWQNIMPYAGLGSFFASLTATGFVWYSYLRNSTIHDARTEGFLYEDTDPRSARLLEETDADESDSRVLSTQESLEANIAERNTQALSDNPAIAAWQMSGRLLKNLRDRIKRKSIQTWYGFQSLENRSKKLRENPQAANEKTALELLGNVMARAFGSVFLMPWHRHAVSFAFPFYFDTRERGGRASLNTLEDRGMWPSPFYLGLRAASYGWGFLYPKFKPDYFWENLDEIREESINRHALIEPAVSLAIRQLEIAKALDLGASLKLIPSILSVERHLHQEGLGWLQRIQERLPEAERMSDEQLRELVAYSDELLRLAERQYFLKRMQVRHKQIDDGLTDTQKKQLLTNYAKEQILSELDYYRSGETSEAAYYRNISHRIRSRWARVQTNHRESFFRIGKSGENLTRPKALLNLGSYPYTHLQDRLIITAQVVPMIASQSLHTNMTEEQLFNGLAPLFLFLGPDNLQNYGSGLAVSSRMIDNLLQGRLQNQNNSYASAVIQSIRKAPWKNIALQSASMLDLRMLSAANSALLMVGMLYPIDIALTAWSSAINGQAFIPTLMSRGAGRIANGLAGATINMGFSIGSVPFYRSLMFIRREAGGIGTNGFESAYRNNPHESADRILFGSAQVVLNILYGLTAGAGVPLLSERLLNAADVQVTQAPTGFQTEAFTTEVAMPAAPSEIILPASLESNCSLNIKESLALLKDLSD